MRIRWTIIFLSCWSATAVLAQPANTVLHQSLYWTRYYLRWEIAPRWTLHAEADNRRFFEPAGGQHQFISHLHVHRAFREKWEAWGGVTYSVIRTQNPNAVPPSARSEIRPWQAISFQQVIKPVNIAHRLRWEARLFGPFIDSDIRFSFRMRYAATLQYPFSRHWAFKTGDEVMVHWGEGIRQAFDQNRIWAGLEFSFAQKHGSIELLYLWMYQQSAGGNVCYDRDVIRLTVGQRIP